MVSALIYALGNDADRRAMKPREGGDLLWRVLVNAHCLMDALVARWFVVGVGEDCGNGGPAKQTFVSAVLDVFALGVSISRW